MSISRPEMRTIISGELERYKKIMSPDYNNYHNEMNIDYNNYHNEMNIDYNQYLQTEPKFTVYEDMRGNTEYLFTSNDGKRRQKFTVSRGQLHNDSILEKIKNEFRQYNLEQYREIQEKLFKPEITVKKEEINNKTEQPKIKNVVNYNIEELPNSKMEKKSIFKKLF